MPEICSGVGKRKEGKGGESVHGMGADRPGGCKEIRGEGCSCADREQLMYMGTIARGRHRWAEGQRREIAF